MANTRKTCNCCGENAGKWEQHWNRDTGYGMCTDCIAMVRSRGMDEAEIISLYGREGINWGSEILHGAAQFEDAAANVGGEK